MVPYNPFLLLKYNAHINIELCSTVKSVKYLYKYIYKGYDCADMQINVKEPVNINHNENKTEWKYDEVYIIRLFDLSL